MNCLPVLNKGIGKNDWKATSSYFGCEFVIRKPFDFWNVTEDGVRSGGRRFWNVGWNLRKGWK